MFMSGYIWYSSAPGGIGGPGVTSVQGQTGAVSLSSTDIPEGTNLYYLDSRAKTAVITQTITNGVTTFSPSEDAVYDALQNYSLVGHTHVAADITDFNSTFDTRFDTNFGLKTTDNLTEGVTNLYYASALFDADLALKTTDNLTEGVTNRYYSDLLAQGAFTAGTDISIALGVISSTYSYTLPIASAVVLGGIKVGAGLSINGSGVLSAIGAVVSVFGRTGTVVAVSGDYTSDQVTEGAINLYYLDSRARGAVAGSGVISYSSLTGIFSIAAATNAVDGYLTATDWTTFNSKQSAITTGDITTTTVGLNIVGAVGAIIGSGVTLDIDTASSSQPGILSSGDWTTFNSKQSALTFGNFSTTNSAITIVNGNNSTVGPAVTIDIGNASASVIGLLTNTDWTTFNSKQPAGSYITALTSDVSASGPGSAAATVNSVGGSSAANINSAELLANAATPLNTINAIVKRDASGGFQAGIVKLLSDTFQFGTMDGFSRTQIWNKASNASLRLGALAQDGDPADAHSEGSIFYGANSQGTAINSPAGDFGYARVKADRFGLYTSISNVAFYYYRVDPTELFLASDSNVKTFTVTRATGAIKTSMAAGAVQSDSSGNLSSLAPGTTGNILTSNGSSWISSAPSASITSLNSLTASSQTFATGTTGTDFGISSGTSTHTFNLPTASATNRGALSSTDWSTFNGKQAALGFTPENVSNKAIDFSTINDTLYPSIKAVYDKIISSLAGLSPYFFYNTASDIGGYLQMTGTAPVGTIQNLTTTGATNDQLLHTFATNSGSPGITFMPSGIVKLHLHAHQTGGTKVTQLYAKVYKRILAGTETLLCTTGNTSALTGVDADLSTDAVIPSGITLLSTDRIIINVYASCPGGGSAPDIEINIEDNTVSRLELPTSVVSATGISSLNGLIGATQVFATGTSGTDFGISSSVTTHTFNIPTASATNRGALSSTDWSTFNGKIASSGVAGEGTFTTSITSTGAIHQQQVFTGSANQIISALPTPTVSTYMTIVNNGTSDAILTMSPTNTTGGFYGAQLDLLPNQCATFIYNLNAAKWFKI